MGGVVNCERLRGFRVFTHDYGLHASITIIVALLPFFAPFTFNVFHLSFSIRDPFSEILIENADYNRAFNSDMFFTKEAEVIDIISATTSALFRPTM